MEICIVIIELLSNIYNFRKISGEKNGGGGGGGGVTEIGCKSS